MKKALLFTFLIFFAFSAYAQLGDCGGCMNDREGYQQTAEQKPIAKKKKISVYPNPAANFIGLSDTDNVGSIAIYNVMGKKEKSFSVTKGEKYNVSDLRRGMYLVQILDKKNKIITTQRLNKS